MLHFRDSRPGLFFKEDDGRNPLPAPQENPPFLRFAAKHGVALDLWSKETAPAKDLLVAANLDWRAHRREVIVPAGPGLIEDTNAHHYRSLVRPDTGQVMSVVTDHYADADNLVVAEALEQHARRISHGESLIAAAGFGRDGERTFFASRITSDSHHAVCLLAYNTHGGDGAVRFQVVEVDRSHRVTYVIDSTHATKSWSHTGDINGRLDLDSRRSRSESFVERYLAETTPLWEQLRHTLWTPGHTNELVHHLWGQTPEAPPTPVSPRFDRQGRATIPEAARHPGHHLPDRMDRATDAAGAFRAVCDWIDNHSEACERGDFTPDRDERLALGAGNAYKRRAWRWIVHNTVTK